MMTDTTTESCVAVNGLTAPTHLTDDEVAAVGGGCFPGSGGSIVSPIVPMVLWLIRQW